MEVLKKSSASLQIMDKGRDGLRRHGPSTQYQLFWGGHCREWVDRIFWSRNRRCPRKKKRRRTGEGRKTIGGGEPVFLFDHHPHNLEKKNPPRFITTNNPFFLSQILKRSLKKYLNDTFFGQDRILFEVKFFHLGLLPLSPPPTWECLGILLLFVGLPGGFGFGIPLLLPFKK